MPPETPGNAGERVAIICDMIGAIRSKIYKLFQLLKLVAEVRYRHTPRGPTFKLEA